MGKNINSLYSGEERIIIGAIAKNFSQEMKGNTIHTNKLSSFDTLFFFKYYHL